MTEEFDFKAFKDGVLAPLLENLLNAALEGELDAHMNADERDAGNCRNGYGSKQVQSSLGELTVHIPRDRDATFDTQFIKKRERILADSLSERILGLYALGTSTREISVIWILTYRSGRESRLLKSPLLDCIPPWVIFILAQGGRLILD